MFNLRIVFTGVVSLVPEGSWENPTRIWALLPNGTADENNAARRSSIDGQPIEIHRGMLTFDLWNLVGGPRARGGIRDRVALPLHDREISFEFDFGLGGAAQQSLITVFDMASITNQIEQVIGERQTDLGRLAMIDNKMIAGASVDSACFEPEPPHTVLSRVLVDTGIVSALEPAAINWVVSGELSDEPAAPLQSKQLAQCIHVDVPGLQDFQIRVRKLPGRDDEGLGFEAEDDWPLSLSPPARSNSVEVTIENLCVKDSVMEESASDPEPDKDFRLHYELLPPRVKQALSRKVLGVYAPHPVPVGGQQSVRGGNCMPGGWQP